MTITKVTHHHYKLQHYQQHQYSCYYNSNQIQQRKAPCHTYLLTNLHSGWGVDQAIATVEGNCS